MRVLTADWVFPIAAPPIAGGAVAIQDGRIVAAGGRDEILAACAGAERWDFAAAALLPGLVNCHTHLELESWPEAKTEEPFVPWVVRLIERRRATPLPAQQATAAANTRALLASGTTCVGEVSSSGQSLHPLLDAGLRGIVYREVLGVRPAEAGARLAAAREDLFRFERAAQGSRLRIGLSPHSPYGLSEELFAACGGLMGGEPIPAAIHAAESPEEAAFIAGGGGAIREILYRAVGCAEPPVRRMARSPLAYLEAMGVLAWRPLLIHAVHVDEADLERVVARGASVAHCPRSNARLSRGAAPVVDYLARGVPVGLGTDSLASAPSLDLWDEMRAARDVQGGRLRPATILDMATRLGARALGLGDEIGSLRPGARADLIAVAAPRLAVADPAGSLIAETSGASVLMSMIDGEVRFRREGATRCG